MSFGSESSFKTAKKVACKKTNSCKVDTITCFLGVNFDEFIALQNISYKNQ